MLRLLLATFFLAVGCSPAMKTDAKLTIHLSQLTSGDALDVRALELSPSLCYALHATGNGLTQIAPEQTPCGPEQGLGMFTARSYAANESFEWSLKVGTERHVELLGFESPLGTRNGHAICGRLDVTLVPRAPEAEDVLPRFRIEGQDVRGRAYVFAASLHTLTPEARTFTLDPVGEAQVGVPWFRADLATAPAFCRPPPPASSHGPLFSASGAGLPEPIRGQKGVGILRSFGQSMAVPGATVRSTSGRAELRAPGASSTPQGR